MSINNELKIIEKHLESYSKTQREQFYIDQSLVGIIHPDSIEWKIQYSRNIIHFKFLQEFLNKYNLNESVIVLKGVALLDLDLYENLGQRLTGDIDLLVADFNLVEHALMAENFKLIESNSWKGNDFKKVYQKNISGIDVAVELHSRLFYHVEFDQYEYKYSLNGLKILSNEWMLAHLVGHLAFQHTFIKIHWLLEVKLFIEKFGQEINWEKFYILINKFQFKRSWFLTDLFINLIFKKIKSKNIFFRLVCNINFILFPEKSKFKYYLIKFLTKDSLLTNLDYSWNWVISRGWVK